MSDEKNKYGLGIKIHGRDIDETAWPDLTVNELIEQEQREAFRTIALKKLLIAGKIKPEVLQAQREKLGRIRKKLLPKTD